MPGQGRAVTFERLGPFRSRACVSVCPMIELWGSACRGLGNPMTRVPRCHLVWAQELGVLLKDAEAKKCEGRVPQRLPDEDLTPVKRWDRSLLPP